MQCPNCSSTLETIEYEGIKIETCPGCEGECLDAGELAPIQMTVEGWQDSLPEPLRKHGQRLRQVATEVEQQSKVKVSRLGLVNAERVMNKNTMCTRTVATQPARTLPPLLG